MVSFYSFMHTLISEKALVVKSGEIHSIESERQVMNMELSLSLDTDIDTSDETIHFINDSKSYEKEGKYYHLDNGLAYHESELIIGIDNIRDYKLKNFID